MFITMLSTEMPVSSTGISSNDKPSEKVLVIDV